MRKTTKSIMITVSALSAIALNSCGVKAKEDFVIDYTYTTPSGTSKVNEISAQDVLDKYLSEEGTTATQAYYNAMYEVALRQEFYNSTGKFIAIFLRFKEMLMKM